MTNDLFPEGASVASIAELSDKITSYRLTEQPLVGICDKWLLASNLQKSIRRGLAANAIATALALQSLDCRYFWRRLLVIAYEDVGLANVLLCHDLLKSFRREALHLRLGARQVAAYFAGALANSCKSRSLCDAIAMLEFNVQREEYEKPWFGMSDAEIVNAVNCTEISITRRVAALRHICGYKDNSRGMYHSITPARTEPMREVCCRLELTKTETTLFISGQSVSDSLNDPIPLVATFARGERQEMQVEQLFDGIDGILYAACDRHTRLGKRCFAKLAHEVEPFRDFFQRQPRKLDPVAVIGAAIFLVEGSCLNRWVIFPQSDDLRKTFEQNFLEHVGVTGESSGELLTTTRNNLPTLNSFRAIEIAANTPR